MRRNKLSIPSVCPTNGLNASDAPTSFRRRTEWPREGSGKRNWVGDRVRTSRTSLACASSIAEGVKPRREVVVAVARPGSERYPELANSDFDKRDEKQEMGRTTRAQTSPRCPSRWRRVRPPRAVPPRAVCLLAQSSSRLFSPSRARTSSPRSNPSLRPWQPLSWRTPRAWEARCTFRSASPDSTGAGTRRSDKKS
jgi:hypothetical protein